MTSKRSAFARIHVDLANEINELWRENKQEISKVQISKSIANVVKQQRNHGLEINFWPLPGKKVIKKQWKIQ